MLKDGPGRAGFFLPTVVQLFRDSSARIFSDTSVPALEISAMAVAAAANRVICGSSNWAAVVTAMAIRVNTAVRSQMSAEVSARFQALMRQRRIRWRA